MMFLAPWLLGGLALASAPIIIHLLNRRRFRYVEWGPMHYLKLTLKTNRKRLRLEQWLLLAIRTLAVAALFLAVARPAVSGTGFGAWLVGRSRTSRVLVVDDSLSMGARGPAGRTAFERAQDAAGKLIEKIGSQDSVTLVVTSTIDRPILRDAYIDKPEEVIGTVRSLKPCDSANHWAAALKGVDDYLKSSTFPLREVTLITDMRAQGWDSELTSIAQRWSADGVKLRIIDMGVDPGANLALLSIQQERPLALVDEPVRFTARVRNDGPDSVLAAQATLTTDGDPRPAVLPDLPAGQTIDVPLTVSFSKPGPHTVDLSLPGDSLAADNHRWQVIDVRRTIDVSLVDGEPNADAFQSETDFLALAYSVGATPWNISKLTDSQWLASPLTAPDVLVLANMATIPGARVNELLSQVQAGMGLMVFLGDQVDSENYNAITALMPARIGHPISGDGDTPAAEGLVVENHAQSPLAMLGKIAPMALAGLRVRKFMELSLAEAGRPGEEVRVLARWNDSAHTPAIVERRVGRGRVVLWNVTADRGWSDWPTGATYVLATREAAAAIAGGGGDSTNLTAGESIRQSLDPNRLPLQGTVSLPGANAPSVVPIDSKDAAHPALVYAATHVAGLYRLEWDEPGSGGRSRSYAVNPDARESDLGAISADDLRGLLGGLRAEVVRFDERIDSGPGEGKELWRTIAAALSVLLVCETALAAWVDRGR